MTDALEVSKGEVMQKGKLRVLGTAVIMSMGLLLSACGSSSNSSYEKSAAGGAYSADYAVAEMASEEMYDEAGGTGTAEQVQDTSRKLIKTVNLETETENLDETVSNVERRVTDLGGYIEASNIYNGTTYSGSSSRSASITARIPASNLDSFVESVEGYTNITRKTVNVDDITLSYVDVESRRNSLRTEEKRLLDIMENAETVEDLITIEDKLADVRYELESIESQLRSYDNKVDYSTVYLDIEEVVKFTPVEKEGALSRMGHGFMESLEAVGNAIVEFVVWFVSNIPQIVFFIIIIVVIVFIIKKISSSSQKRKAKKMQAYYQGMAQSQMAAPVNQAPVNQAPVNLNPANQPANTPEKGNDGKQ
jgi:hypothetical protein